jgi:hypothetical protein
MDFKLSYYQTSHGGEIDLVLSKGRKKFLVEIKSTTQVDHQEVLHFERLAQASLDGATQDGLQLGRRDVIGLELADGAVALQERVESVGVKGHVGWRSEQLQDGVLAGGGEEAWP